MSLWLCWHLILFLEQLACENDHLEMVKFLVEKGVNNHLDDENALPLACENGHLEVVKFLVDKS